jgi:hypothetical protein
MEKKIHSLFNCVFPQWNFIPGEIKTQTRKKSFSLIHPFFPSDGSGGKRKRETQLEPFSV